MKTIITLLFVFSIVVTVGWLRCYGLYLSTLSLLEKTQEQRDIDPLTGIFNRFGFSSVAEKVFALLKRDRVQSVSVAVIDLDDFKKVNDTHGHSFGDSTLSVFGEILKANVREADVIGRRGGDEFVVLFPRATDAEVSQILSRVCEIFERKMDILYKEKGSERPPTVSMTFGVAEGLVSLGYTLEELCEKADTALYEAKRRKGRC